MEAIYMTITKVTTYTPCEERQNLDTTYYPLTLVKRDTDEGVSGCLFTQSRDTEEKEGVR